MSSSTQAIWQNPFTQQDTITLPNNTGCTRSDWDNEKVTIRQREITINPHACTLQEFLAGVVTANATSAGFGYAEHERWYNIQVKFSIDPNKLIESHDQAEPIGFLRV